MPDWGEIRLVIRLLEPYATTPMLQETLLDLLAAPDRASLKLAVNRVEAAFGNVETSAAQAAGRVGS